MLPDNVVPSPPPTRPVPAIPVAVPMRWRRRPLVVTAVRVDSINAREAAAWCDGTVTADGRHVVVDCRDGRPRIAGPGDYITEGHSDGSSRRLGVVRRGEFESRFMPVGEGESE